VHTAAFQSGRISQLSSVATLSFSPSCSRTWEFGDAGHRSVQVAEGQGPIGVAAAVVVVEPGIERREIDRLGVDEFAPLMVLLVLSPALVNSRKDSAPVLRCSLSWKFTNVVFTTSSR
jgi:hypothetical protein